MEARSVTCTLRIDVGSEPISGDINAANQPPQPFCGWQELVAAIEEARILVIPLGPTGAATPADSEG